MEFRLLRHPEYNLVTLQLRHSSIFTENTCELSHPRKTNNSGRVKRVHLHLHSASKENLLCAQQKIRCSQTKAVSIKAKGESKTKQVKRGKSNQKKWEIEVSCTQFTVNGVKLLKVVHIRTPPQKKSHIADETSAGRGTRGPLGSTAVLCWESSVFAGPAVCWSTTHSAETSQ